MSKNTRREKHGDQWVVVATTDTVHATAMVEQLHSVGIPAVVLPEGASLLPTVVGTLARARVMVPKIHYQRAKDILGWVG